MDPGGESFTRIFDGNFCFICSKDNISYFYSTLRFVSFLFFSPLGNRIAIAAMQ